ncbi:hypothetical protein EG68_09686 [Paragonimus skrjabini miyazakii]|uniref:Heat shock protein 70 n=1 Tax=Paragonimus skrjabini miyazakii TaxID=59628 RepID=A0A8S9YMW0_9TREM|nr:hypothetical protein EG68_09686 [Paragonimus skrjabini miyazakii]
MELAIGIDLGTTFCCLAVAERDGVRVLENDQGLYTTPSCISFSSEEELIGKAAIDQAPLNEKNTVYDIKRMIGRKFTDATVIADRENWPFTVIEHENSLKVEINLDNEVKLFDPVQLSAKLLCYMKKTAKMKLGQQVNKCVISVPARFNELQRQATKDAARIAGLEVLQLINEPTAAAIAYQYEKKDNREKNVLVYDLGGGTLDITILHVKDQVYTVKASFGDTHLGGRDFDETLIKYCEEHLNPDESQRHDLREACQNAKILLSKATSATIGLGMEGETPLIVSRAKFEELNEKNFQKTMKLVEAVLLDASLKATDIHEVVLVGGSTRIPKIQALLTELFGQKVTKANVNPDEVVARGAAILARKLTNSSVEKEEVTDFILKDVTPLAVGSEDASGKMNIFIKRNTQLPATNTKIITNASDQQTLIEINMYQGEHERARDNYYLGQLEVDLVHARKVGEANIELTFHMDVNGTLHVTANDKDHEGKVFQTKITGQSRLSEQDIVRMRLESLIYSQVGEHSSFE